MAYNVKSILNELGAKKGWLSIGTNGKYYVEIPLNEIMIESNLKSYKYERHGNTIRIDITKSVKTQLAKDKATAKLNIKPRKMKRYGTTASRSHYGTLDKARASAYAELSRVKDKPHSMRVIAIYDANIGTGDMATEKNTVGYVQSNWYGKICWATPMEYRNGWVYHYVRKDGSIRKIKG